IRLNGRDNTSSRARLPSSFGRAPERRFKPSRRFLRLASLPRSLGMAPERELPSSSSVCRPGSFERAAGRAPVRPLSLRERPMTEVLAVLQVTPYQEHSVPALPPQPVRLTHF